MYLCHSLPLLHTNQHLTFPLALGEALLSVCPCTCLCKDVRSTRLLSLKDLHFYSSLSSSHHALKDLDRRHTPGNERADRLAREAVIRAALPSPVPCSDVPPTIREAIIAIWQESWNVPGATSKIGEINRTVSHPWNYTNVQDRRLQTSLAHL